MPALFTLLFSLVEGLKIIQTSSIINDSYDTTKFSVIVSFSRP